MSLGKINFYLSSLVDIDLIKLFNFKNSKSNIGYLYVLTPLRIKAKVGATRRFLKINNSSTISSLIILMNNIFLINITWV